MERGRRQVKKDSVMKKTKEDPNLLEEYDFTDGVRGKYAECCAEGTNLVPVDPDLMAFLAVHEA